MMFQMQNFINTLNDICDFTFLDGPFNEMKFPPLQYFVKKGITPPYKRWAILDVEEIGPFRKTNVNVNGTIIACFYILNFLN